MADKKSSSDGERGGARVKLWHPLDEDATRLSEDKQAGSYVGNMPSASRARRRRGAALATGHWSAHCSDAYPANLTSNYSQILNTT